MQKRKIAALLEIAAMLKERDMAALSRLNLHKQALLDQRSVVQDEQRAAHRAGLASVEAATAAEKHARWAERRDLMLQQQLATLQGEIAQQISHTTRSVGRHGNLQKILKK